MRGEARKIVFGAVGIDWCWRTRYPRIEFLGGVWEGDKFEWGTDAIYRQQHAFLTDRDCLWGIASDPRTAKENWVPYWLKKASVDADEVIIKMVSPLRICGRCHSALERGCYPSFWDLLGDFRFLHSLMARSDFYSERHELNWEVKKFITEFLVPFSSKNPILFSLCRKCKTEGVQEKKFEPESFKFIRHAIRRIHGVAPRPRKDSYRRMVMERALSRYVYEGPLSNFKEASQSWEQREFEDLYKRHVKKRRSRKDVNFFSMVNAMGALTKVK